MKKEKQVKLVPPFPNRPFGGKTQPHKPVYVDKSISKTIQHLWEHNIYTKGSCSGHGKENPNIVVENDMCPENAEIIKKLIAEIDGRQWDILSWKLTKL